MRRSLRSMCPDYPQHPEITYSVKYKHGPGHKPEGTLSPGGEVMVKEGEVIQCFTNWSIIMTICGDWYVGGTLSPSTAGIL